MSYQGIMQDLGSNPTPVTGFYRILQTLTPAAVGANTTSEQTFTVPGVLPGDSVDINKASHQTGLGILNVVVKNPNQLSITYVNTTAGSITPTSEQYVIGGMR
jgi:hypothetical protein